MARPRKRVSTSRGRPPKTSNNHATVSNRLINEAARKRMENLRKLKKQKEKTAESNTNQINGLNTDGSLYDLVDMKKWNRLFQSELDKEKYETCSNCNESFFNLNLKNSLCIQCCKNIGKEEFIKFTNLNKMEPCEIPQCLRDLNEVEQLLIAKIHPQIFVYHLSGGQLGYKGHVINFSQNVTEFAKVLPHKLATLTNMIVVRTSKDISLDDLKVNKKKFLMH